MKRSSLAEKWNRWRNLEWNLSWSASHWNLQPLVSGARLSISKRAAKSLQIWMHKICFIMDICLPNYKAAYSLLSNLQATGFLLVVMWVPWSCTLCFFPGESGMWLAWDLKKLWCHVVVIYGVIVSYAFVWIHVLNGLEYPKKRKLLWLAQEQLKACVHRENRSLTHPGYVFMNYSI